MSVEAEVDRLLGVDDAGAIELAVLLIPDAPATAAAAGAFAAAFPFVAGEEVDDDDDDGCCFARARLDERLALIRFSSS